MHLFIYFVDLLTIDKNEDHLTILCIYGWTSYTNYMHSIINLLISRYNFSKYVRDKVKCVRSGLILFISMLLMIAIIGKTLVWRREMYLLFIISNKTEDIFSFTFFTGVYLQEVNVSWLTLTDSASIITRGIGDHLFTILVTATIFTYST